jgi:hypothetical protein
MSGEGRALAKAGETFIVLEIEISLTAAKMPGRKLGRARFNFSGSRGMVASFSSSRRLK